MIEKYTAAMLRDQLLGIAEARQLPSDDKPLGLNLAKAFGVEGDREVLIKLFEEMANRTLTPKQRQLAITTGARVAKSDTPSVVTLLEAWNAEPSLEVFAAAVLYAAFPGESDDAERVEGLTMKRRGKTTVVTPHTKPR